MKKITLIIIVFSIMLASQAYAMRCTGTCASCSSISGGGACNSQAGCTFSAGSCKGTCTPCTTYSSQTTCNAQTGCSWQAVCSDGTCDTTEDCGCSDCEGEQATCQSNYFCSGGACVYSGAGGACADAGGQCQANPCGDYINCEEAVEACTSGYCCTGSCTTRALACGDGICEGEETCLNCETDCGTCTEGPLYIAVREPTDRETIKRGTHLLKIAVFQGKGYTSSVRVFVKSPLLPFGLELYDDRKHNDEGILDGVYANEFVISRDIKPGQYPVTITAEKPGLRAEVTIKLNIDPVLRINLTNFKSAYLLGDGIELSGAVSDFKAAAPNVTLNISLFTLEAQNIYGRSHITDSKGMFSGLYYVSFADPEGEWQLVMRASDKDGNDGMLNLNTTIGAQEGVLYYLINFLSPVKGAQYPRGQKVPVTVEVSEEGKPVGGANVSFSSPAGEQLTLAETEQGVYTGEYAIKLDDPPGQWRVAAQAVKKEGNITKAGGNFIPLQVNPAEISIEFLSPAESTALTGAEMEYKVKAGYPDGTPVRGADLMLKLRDKIKIPMEEIEEGIYAAKYLLGKEETGTLSASVAATDGEGNRGEAKSKDIFVRTRTLPELYMLIAYQKVLRPYWWALASVLLIAGLVLAPHYKVKMLKRKIAKAKAEQEKVKSMQIEVEQEYYSKGAVSKEDFRKLVQQYKERAAKASEQLRSAEELLRKKREPVIKKIYKRLNLLKAKR